MNFHHLYDKNSRRRFIKKMSLAGISISIGSELLFADELVRSKLVGRVQEFNGMEGKHPDLTLINDRPWNIEAPAHLLNENVTSASRLFVRNNGLVPTNIDVENWTLEIGGESVKNPATFTLGQLKTEFQTQTLQLTLECGGNGRAEFSPPAKGNQWTTGAVGSPKWTGIRLKDVLDRVGVTADAVYIGYYGKDTHLSGDKNKTVISRGVPLSKAMEAESLIAWSVNGQELPLMNGFPLRLVFGGWPASTSGKWLSKIVVRNRVHDGPKMGGQSYRLPCETVAPGSIVADEDMCIIESMPVKSLITYPKSGASISQSKTLEFSGHAWAGDRQVRSMEFSIDFGSSWSPLQVEPPVNRLAWQHWRGTARFPMKGYYELWVRATDTQGDRQAMVLPGWNPRGYLNNACHRIAIRVTA